MTRLLTALWILLAIVLAVDAWDIAELRRLHEEQNEQIVLLVDRVMWLQDRSTRR